MLRKFKDELSLMLKKNQTEIIGLNEIRLNQTIKDQEVHVDGLQIFRNYRNIDAGRVAFYVKGSLADVKIKLKCNELDLLYLEITPRSAKSM